MTRTLKLTIAAFALALLGLAGARASAERGPNARAEKMKAKLTAHVDEALDEAAATAPQRAAIYAARDRLFGAFSDSRHDRTSEIEEALTLFQAERLDAKAVAAHRGRREAEVKKIGDAMVQALNDVHDALYAIKDRRLVRPDVLGRLGGERTGRGPRTSRGPTTTTPASAR